MIGSGPAWPGCWRAPTAFAARVSTPTPKTRWRPCLTLKPDVVLMDIKLPRMSGVECVAQLKPVLPKTQFIMLTVYQENELIFRALAAGATGYLLKRTRGPQLAAAIRDVHRGGSPMSNDIARKVVAVLPSGNAAASSRARR